MGGSFAEQPGWGDTDWLDWSDGFGPPPNRTFERVLRKYAAATILGLRVPHLPGDPGQADDEVPPRLGDRLGLAAGILTPSFSA